jgi:hypothetical protein
MAVARKFAKASNHWRFEKMLNIRPCFGSFSLSWTLMTKPALVVDHLVLRTATEEAEIDILRQALNQGHYPKRENGCVRRAPLSEVFEDGGGWW